MIVVQLFACIIDPLVLNLLTRLVAREEAELSYWRGFFASIFVVVTGIGMSTLFQRMEYTHWAVTEVAVAGILFCFLIHRAFCIPVSRAIVVTLLFAAYRAMVTSGIVFLGFGDPELSAFERLVSVQFPTADQQADWISPEFWLKD